jgi:hypothetical protein
VEHAPNGNGVLIQTNDPARLQSEALSFACQDSLQYATLVGDRLADWLEL